MSFATRASDRRSRTQAFRPFPLDEVREALADAKRVIVLEKALAIGIGGIVSANVRMALSGIELHGYTVIAGLGGRAITQNPCGAVRGWRRRQAQAAHFLDLDGELVERELRACGRAPPGPHAREHAARHRRRRRAVRTRRSSARPGAQAVPDGNLRGRQPAAGPRAALGAGPHGPLQLPHLRPPGLSGLRRSAGARATSSTRRCAPPTAG